MSSTFDGDKDKLVQDLAWARDELRASYRGLSDDQMVRSGAVGHWSVKDVLSHVTSWDEVVLPDLERLTRGERPALASIDLKTADFDGANAVIMSQRRSRPQSQVLRELDSYRDDVVAALGRLPDSALTEGHFGRLLIQITAAHDREHAEAILCWRRQEGL